MTFISSYRCRRWFAWITCILSLLIAQVSSASELPQSVGLEAIKLAEKIEADNLYVSDDWLESALQDENTAPSKRLTHMRMAFSLELRQESQDELRHRAEKYAQYAQTHGTIRDQRVGQLFIAVADTFDSANPKESSDKVLAKVRPYLKDNDWFVQLWALAFKWEMEVSVTNTNTALQSAQEAFKLVPEGETSAYAKEAKVVSLEGLSYLYYLMRNPELGLAASRRSIDLQVDFGMPVDGISVINNLIYSFDVWREHETSKTLLDILLRLEEKTQSGFPGLTHMRAAQIHNDLGNYDIALNYAESSLKNTKVSSIQELADVNRIIALVGLGRVKEGEELLSNYLDDNIEGKTVSKRTPLRLLYAQALVALKKDDMDKAVRFMNQRLDKSVQYNLAISNADTARVLASLQNSKERQDEREKALERESELKQVALERQQRVNNLLIIIAIIFALSAVIAIAFARYRSKVAARMSEAADKARAGEKAKSEFLAVMSHELRTPLNGILGLADFLSRTAPTEDLREKNKIIFQSGQDLLSLVENILDMTLIEGNDIHPHAEEINIRKLLSKQEAKWREIVSAKDVIFTTFVDPNVPEKTMLDPRRVSQCVDNLLSNAVKFTMAGRIHMHVTSTSSGIPLTDHLTIVVADTGTGISEDAQTRLFKPFVQADSSMTRHFGGAGLGLAIARSLARLMGGDITVISRENRGSEFTLTLVGEACVPVALPEPQPTLEQQSHPINNIPSSPEDIVGTVSKPAIAAEALAPAAIQEPTASIISLSGINILIVEDDLASQDVLRTILSPTRCKLDTATDGQIALNKLSKNTYDLVLMDIRMPGMDGVTAIRHIRQSRDAHNHVPIITVTADVSAETNIKCMAAGVDIFLTKPVRTQELLDAISYVLQERETRQTA